MRVEAVLAEDAAQQAAAADARLHRGFELGAEAGEHFELEKLQVVELHAAGFALDGFMLGLAADARDRAGDVDGGQHAAGKRGVEVNLPVGDGDEVGGDVGGDLALLGPAIGSAVMLPPPPAVESRVERSSSRAWR